jgi:hypothetical protein
LRWAHSNQQALDESSKETIAAAMHSGKPGSTLTPTPVADRYKQATFDGTEGTTATSHTCLYAYS